MSATASDLVGLLTDLNLSTISMSCEKKHKISMNQPQEETFDTGFSLDSVYSSRIRETDHLISCSPQLAEKSRPST